MSRLESHQQKQFIKKLIFYVVLLCLIIFIMLSVGLKFLINATLFISGMGSNKNVSEPLEKKDTFYGNIEVDSLPNATNSARFAISGSVLNFDNLEFYINDDKVKELNVSTSDSFSEVIGDLKKGSNEVYVKATSKKSKNEKKSNVFTVLYKSDKPKLEVSEPGDNAKINTQEITLKGQTNSEVYITVNGSPVVVDASGNFQTIVRLKDGENKIEIAATDDAGNKETKTLTVTYQAD